MLLIAQWLLEDPAMSQSEIAERLAALRPYVLSQQMVSNDVAAIHERWREDCSRAYDHHVAESVARLKRVQAEAFAEWHRSKNPATSKGTKTKGQKDGGQSGVMTASIETLNEEKCRLGDPRYLKVIIEAEARKAKALGSDAPERLDHTVAVADPLADYLAMPAERRRDMLARVLSRLDTRDGQQ